MNATNKFQLFLVLVFTFLLIPSFIFAFNCTVTRILDGDTFHCLPEKPLLDTKIHKDGTISVRMCGIDAPEKRQPYGEEARLSLKELIGGKIVKLVK